MGKKLVMAQKRGETRALCLGVAMVVGAVITYYILGTTVLPLYQKSVFCLIDGDESRLTCWCVDEPVSLSGVCSRLTFTVLEPFQARILPSEALLRVAVCLQDIFSGFSAIPPVFPTWAQIKLLLHLLFLSVWTQESTCHLIETNIRDQEELEGKRVPQYPCLWVNVSSVGRWAVLYHTEDTREQNHQCSYIPSSLDNYQVARADVEKVRARFHEHQDFFCFSTTRENETSVLYRRLYGPQSLLFSLFWPTFLLTGGLLIIVMVKINQSLSILAAQR